MTYDNYNGIYSLNQNPASQVESKFKIGVNLVEISNLNYSEAGQFGIAGTVDSPNGFNSLLFDSEFGPANRRIDAARHHQFLFPSFSWNLSRRQSLAFTIRSRFVENFESIDPFLWQGVYDQVPETAQDVNLDVSSLNYLGHRWKEIGVSYAYQLMEKKRNHALSLGVTGKYLIGNGYTQVSSPQILGDYNSNGDLFNLSGSFSISSTFELLEEASDKTNKESSAVERGQLENTWNSITDFSSRDSGNNFSIDFGFVYEYRPNSTNRIGRGRESRLYNKYKLRLGVAVLDLGSISYKDVRRENYTFNSVSFSGNELSQEGFQTVLSGSNAAQNSPRVLDHRIYLPSRLNLNLDFLCIPQKNLYLNLNVLHHLTHPNVRNLSPTLQLNQSSWQNSLLNSITLTPRIESAKMSVQLPITYVEQFGLDISTGVRFNSFQLMTNFIFAELFDSTTPSLQLRYAIQLSHGKKQ